MGVENKMPMSEKLQGVGGKKMTCRIARIRADSNYEQDPRDTLEMIDRIEKQQKTSLLIQSNLDSMHSEISSIEKLRTKKNSEDSNNEMKSMDSPMI
jgi:hypothetical protein